MTDVLFVLFVVVNSIWAILYLSAVKYYNQQIIDVNERWRKYASECNERWYKHTLECNESWYEYLDSLADGFYQQTGKNLDILNQRIKEIEDVKNMQPLSTATK